jgi:hypothetical protein
VVAGTTLKPSRCARFTARRLFTSIVMSICSSVRSSERSKRRSGEKSRTAVADRLGEITMESAPAGQRHSGAEQPVAFGRRESLRRGAPGVFDHGFPPPRETGHSTTPLLAQHECAAPRPFLDQRRKRRTPVVRFPAQERRIEPEVRVGRA